MIYYFLEETGQLLRKHFDILSEKDQELIRVCSWICHHIVINGTFPDLRVPFDIESLKDTMPSLFNFLDAKSMHSFNLSQSVSSKMQDIYSNWIKKEKISKDEVSFSEVVPPLLAFYLSFTDEYDDESFPLLEQDKVEDDALEVWVDNKEEEEKDQLTIEDE